jgi:hypothetical protein
MQSAASASPRTRTWSTLVAVTALVGGIAYATRETAPVVTPLPAAPAITTIELATQPEPTVAPAPPIEIIGVASRRQISSGVTLPLTFYVVNRTDHALPVLRSLDASDMGWRYPKIDIEIRDAKGRLIEPGGIGRCGLVNPLQADDFVELAAGERLDLLGEGGFGHHRLRYPLNLAPGTYTVMLRYDISFAERERKGGEPDTNLRAKIDRLPRGVYTSAPVTIEIK